MDKTRVNSENSLVTNNHFNGLSQNAQKKNTHFQEQKVVARSNKLLSGSNFLL